MAADDSSVLELIWDRYAARLHVYLIGLLHSGHDAEDVLQDVLVKIAGQRDRLRTVENLQAYFFAMARNEALSLLRRRARRNKPLHPDDLWLVPANDRSADEDTTREVRRVLGALPEKQRAVVMLKIYQEMTFQEIADAFGISVNTAASRYRYATDKLRGLLKENAP